ncbi:hypothetical protein GOP47_0025982 [Adiantum capillus-veneris]|uniref:Non-specific serine/threonine protein kinase n=1 Tax=Adiantum capillus-veneris TaxID=13818 RepID=A0A9D4Z2K5_ADICA|nr:hypothetical protein GOP47_0025982 [Adiantum capillus-veneris]
MEPPFLQLLLLLLSPSLSLTIFCPALSLGVRVPLPPHWSFSSDLSLASPLPRNAYTAPSPSLFTPILSTRSFSSSKGFSLGFFSSFSPNASTSSSSSLPTSTFLTVCLGTNQTDSNGRTFAVPVWHFDRTYPLRQLGIKEGLISLSVNSLSKELILKDGDGTVVFSISNVQAMELQDNGNWVLYDPYQKVLWQSFDHPSDTLLQGQYLGVGMKLMSNNSLYVAEMKRGGLIFYFNSKAPAHLIYWAVPLNVSAVEYVKDNAFELSTHPMFNLTSSLVEFSYCNSSLPLLAARPTPYTLFQGNNLTVQGDCSHLDWPVFNNIFQNNSVSADFVLLANDGYPKGYTYIHNHGENFLFSGQASTAYCLIPYTCGAYGICTEFVLGLEKSCHCPFASENGEFKDAFAYNDPSDPTQGCHRTLPLQCLDDASAEDNMNLTSLVEIKKSTLISIHFIFETTYIQNTFPLPDCKERCMRNCSCSGFYYHSSQSFCLPFSDDWNAGAVPSVTFIAVQSSEFSTYVKVQTPKAVHIMGSGAPEMSGSSHHLSTAVLLSIVLATSMLVLLAGVFTIFKYKNRLRNVEEEEQAEAEDMDLQGVLPLLPMRFPYKELYKITGGFSLKNLIGSGGFGCVYQGVFPDGRKVAVKRLHQGSPRLKEFLAEIAIIGDVSHCNVAPLCGYCMQKLHRVLVYEYMENGSLDRWLFSDNKDSLLDWATRYRIALGTARGLTYLHEECPKPIIHFDVKPQNILLNKDFVAKISDFGMCKLVGKADSSCVMTGVRGTPGYLAPEWLANSTVGKKCDVYSYGMVLFEMVGGRKNALQALVGTDQWYLPRFAAMLWKEGRIGELVDERLEGVYEEEQVRRMIHVAFLCIQRDPNLRPTMGHVFKMIEGSMALGEEDPPYEMAVDLLCPLLSPQKPLGSPSYGSCTSALLVGR